MHRTAHRRSNERMLRRPAPEPHHAHEQVVRDARIEEDDWSYIRDALRGQKHPRGAETGRADKHAGARYDGRAACTRSFAPTPSPRPLSLAATVKPPPAAAARPRPGTRRPDGQTQGVRLG